MFARSLALAGSLVLLSAAAHGQATIKVSDDVNLRFGALLQGWADWTQDPISEGYSQNLFLRRVRLLVGGQVAKNVTFFIETDNPSLGRAGAATPAKNLATGFIVQDALAEVKFRDAFIFSGGLMFVPFCRNCIQSAATLLSLDYSSWSFLATPATQSSVGRDVGAQAKGYLAGNRVEYRVGLFQGFRQPSSPTTASGRNPLRAVGRLQVNFLEPEAQGIFYTGTYLGTKRVLAVGIGVDGQAGPDDDYRAFAVDAFLDHPVGRTMAVTAQLDFFKYDGGDLFAVPALAEHNAIFFEGGLFLKQMRIMPFVKFETQSFAEAVDEPRNSTRAQLGLTYYKAGHNANFKFAVSQLNPKVGETTNGLTGQMQVFFY